MTKSQPPRLAVALLHRFVSEDALVGDLVEEFEAGHSRLWFWRQVLLAVLIGPFRQPHEIRPLRLVEGDPSRAYREPSMAREGRPKTVNLAASPRGACVGGLGLVAVAVLITIVLPQAWWLLFFGFLAGILLGIVMVVVSRHHVLSGPKASSPTLIRRD